jgi:hypothetical protein
MEGDPKTWWRNSARLVIDFKRKVQDIQDPDMRVYFETQVPNLLSRLRLIGGKDMKDENEYVEEADHEIMNFSMEQAAPFERKDIKIETHFLPLDVIVKSQPDRFKSEDRMIQGIDCTVLHVNTPITKVWQQIPLPKNEKLWQKGGGARFVGDVVFRSPYSMQESESPINDYDVLIGNLCNNRTPLALGVDADGIEHMGEDYLNFSRYCAGRDTTQNQILLGAEGLYYSKEAMTSAITGHTRIENEYVANKAIYGFDKMIIQGETLAKSRGLMRLVKAVTEGKALSFDHIPLNTRFDMSVNSLFLAKRWSKKDNFPVHLQRMYFLLKQMGQIRDGESDMFDTLERAHSENPFYDFDSEVKYPDQVVRWKSRKLVKQIDRETGWRFNIPTGMVVNRVPGDNVPIRISLDNFSPDPKKMDIQKKWDSFLDRSRQRTKEHQAKNPSAYDKIFRYGYEDGEGSVGSMDDVLIDEDD